MKRYFFRMDFYCAGLAIVLILFDFSSASCQIPELQNSSNYRLLQLYYTNSSGEEALTEFEYDAFGNMKFSKWKLLNGERNSVNRYILNEDAQIIEKYRIFSDSISSKQVYAYNLCGKMVSESFSRSDGTEGVANYIYDEHGKLACVDCQNFNGWFTGKIVYVYNAYDVIDEAIIQKGDQTIGEITYQYDINGNLKIEKWDFNGLWEQALVYDYIEVPKRVYASSNPFIINSGFYKVEEEYYEYSGGGSGPSLYEYDNGKLIKKVFTRSDGLTTETTYKYNDAGLLISSLRKYSDGKTADFYYLFDSDNRMTKRWFKRSDQLEGEEIFTYDSQGRMVMAKYKKMDAWLSGTITFDHDQNGLPVKGYFNGEDNFDADIFFEYDKYNNLIKLKWDFSFGKSQVYTFKYCALYMANKYSSDPLQ